VGCVAPALGGEEHLSHPIAAGGARRRRVEELGESEPPPVARSCSGAATLRGGGGGRARQPRPGRTVSGAAATHGVAPLDGHPGSAAPDPASHPTLR